MTISPADIYLFKSQVIADTPDGGGPMTGIEVVDGELNNLFDDSSRTDRVNGRVSVRKAFGAVRTSTRDKYLGAHAVLTHPPADARVVATILDLDDYQGRRIDAKAFVESYLVASVETQMTLYSAQPQGARTLVVYQNLNAPLPSVSDVLCLSVEQLGHAFFGRQQFLRITSLTTGRVTGIDTNGREYSKTLLTLGLSESLEVTYPGNDLTENTLSSNKPTRVRKTDLSPNARFYGVSGLATAVGEGDTVVRVQSVLQPVVPASYAESPLLDQQIAATGSPLTATGGAISETLSGTAVGGVLALQLLRPSLPASVTVVADASGSDNDVTLTEGANGVLTRGSGGVATAGAAGTVVSVAGQVRLTGLPNVAYTVTVSYTPAASVPDVQHTAGTLITLANRGFNYSKTLLPKPARGSVQVHYLALGNWYVLTDNGAGQLTGATGTGAGTVNYLTGTVNVTVGYQPDVGSQVLFGWGTGAHYATANDASALVVAVNGGVAAQQGLVPGSVAIAWTHGINARQVTDDGAGHLTGDGSGTVNYAAGTYQLTPAVLPPAGTVFTLTATRRDYASGSSAFTQGGAANQLTLTGAPAAQNAVEVLAIFRATMNRGYATEVRDVTLAVRSQGNAFRLTNRSSNNIALLDPYRSAEGVVVGNIDVGSINHSTGEVSLPFTLAEGYRYYAFNSDAGAWVAQLTDLQFVGFQTVFYTRTTGTSTAVSSTATLSSLRIDLAPNRTQGFAANTLLLKVAGRRYADNNGVISYRQSNGTVVNAGTVDLTSGLVVITDWADAATDLTIDALLSRLGNWRMGTAIWRTNGNPLRPQSFEVTNGLAVAGSATNGTVTGSFASGSINVDTGVYSLTFSPPALPESLRYNAVALTYLPIDADVLGINAVRLPLDGRVPIYRAGDTLLLSNQASQTLPNPAVAGSTVTLSRDRLAEVLVTDTNGLKVPTSRYSVNLDAGTLTWATPLDLTGYVQPLVARHSIEDMMLCVDAQLTGEVQISGAITHDYPALGTYLSSAKLYGDLQALISTPYGQQAWTGVWSDVRIGNDTTGQFNASAFPPVITNAGAATERWRVEFINANQYRLIGEHLGQIDTGTTLADFAPVNPASGEPYFTLPAGGWGSGWVAGNQLRFNTTACAAAIWILRCTLQGPASEPDDAIRLQFRGDH